eukprot:1464077-Rhodomonas_salina.1
MPCPVLTSCIPLCRVQYWPSVYRYAMSGTDEVYAAMQRPVLTEYKPLPGPDMGHANTRHRDRRVLRRVPFYCRTGEAIRLGPPEVMPGTDLYPGTKTLSDDRY